MNRVVIIGCGVIGAAIAYELSAIPGLDITVLDRQLPAQGSTGAALGVLMGAISQKRKGRAWQQREHSLRQYEAWVPELERLTGQSILFNRDGLVRLTFDDDDMDKWKTLQTVRRQQGWPLDIWDVHQLQERCPGVGERLSVGLPVRSTHRVITGAIHSPRDRQIDPKALTQALVLASQQQGVTVHINTEVEGFDVSKASTHESSAYGLSITTAKPSQIVHTCHGAFEADWIIIAAGLGATELTQRMPSPVDIRPVLGQALRVKLPGDVPLYGTFQPVITSGDMHVIPLGRGEYWVGATVEFPDEAGQVSADDQQLQAMWEGAIAMYPPLAQGEILHQWSGLRPRPFGRPAPIVKRMESNPSVILAAGHYRNGILLAPATARLVRDMIDSERD